MPLQTEMSVYPDVVLECQRCYGICRLIDAAKRRTCPSCGLDIINWDELIASLQEQEIS